MNRKTLQLIVIVVFGFVVLDVLSKYASNKVWYTSKTDNSQHLVADLPDKETSARTLGEIKARLNKLIQHLRKKYPNDKRVKTLEKRFDSNTIQETDWNDPNTSYTVDKGSEIHMCLRDKNTKKVHDINLLMFVAVHELAHVMSKTFGHNNEFRDNFYVLLNEASNCNVYTPEDYRKNTKTFCGVKVSENPLF